MFVSLIESFKQNRELVQELSLQELQRVNYGSVLGVAEEFGVSRERVRQIEVRAFEKVQKAVRTRVADMETPSARIQTPAMSML